MAGRRSAPHHAGRSLLALCAAAGCSFDPAGSSSQGPGDAGNADGSAAQPDASTAPGAHLVLSEIKTAPGSLEFIEIFNPTCEPVALDDYHLTDDPAYALLPGWGGAPPDLGEIDAVVRFPAGAVIEPGGVVVVARRGSEFEAAYGVAPDFALGAFGAAQAMTFVARGDTDDMKLDGDGEPVVLFTWDGASDLVEDVDIVIAGAAPIPAHTLTDKRDLAPLGVDGPDADDITTLYRTEAMSIGPMAVRDDSSSSTASAGAYQRIHLEAGHEVETGGNGFGGHDETTEDTGITWEQEAGTAPTPGSVPLVVDCAGT